MMLATLIRLEMAYPGIGVLAGDATQYLSIVTAHGIIMVFFMAIPLLFGFLGNFLLPTQLGVHDVAFPRMNSAAFWFLPASLLALAHLLCTDRRYNKLNQFNVIELQDLLRRKYSNEIIIPFGDSFEPKSSSIFSFKSYSFDFNARLPELATNQRSTGLHYQFNFNKVYRLYYSLFGVDYSFFNSKLQSVSLLADIKLLNEASSRFSSDNYFFSPYKIKTGDYLPTDLYSFNFVDLFSSLSFVPSLNGHGLFYCSGTFSSFNNEYLAALLKLEVDNVRLPSTTGYRFSDNFWLGLDSLRSLYPFELYFNLNRFFLYTIFSQIKQTRFLTDARNLQVTREG